MIQPIQKFIDAENYDLSQLEENILAYYTFDGELYSMPFNSSNPILYYNKDMFREAGLDPERPPRTYSEVEEYRARLDQGWEIRHILCALRLVHGTIPCQCRESEYVDNGNGRHALAETRSSTGKSGVKTMEWWKRMVDEGISSESRPAALRTRQAAFAAGQVAMTLDSDGRSCAAMSMPSAASSKWEPAFCRDWMAHEDGGVIIGGASLWMMNDRPEAEQQAAWEFMKFLA